MKSKKKYMKRPLWKVTDLISGEVHYTQDSAKIVQIENKLALMSVSCKPTIKLEYIEGGAEYILYAETDSLD